MDLGVYLDVTKVGVCLVDLGVYLDVTINIISLQFDIFCII